MQGTVLTWASSSSAISLPIGRRQNSLGTLPEKFDVCWDSPKAVGFQFQSRSNSILFFHAQACIAQFK
jgi:hypothetical protein